MFWKKKTDADGKPKLPGPTGIPELAGRHMVVEMHKDPDYVWKLRAVNRPVGKKDFYCRVFDDADLNKAKLQVKDWTSLDGHPELIVWEGYYDKNASTAKPGKFVESST